MTGLIFDMDGVIVDANAMHRAAWVVFNRRYGLEATEQMQQGACGKRNDQIVRHYFGDGIGAEEVEARGRAKERLYRELAAGRAEEVRGGWGREGGPRRSCTRRRRRRGQKRCWCRACAGSWSGTAICRWRWGATRNPRTRRLCWRKRDCVHISGWWLMATRYTIRNPIPTSTCGPRSYWKPSRQTALFSRTPTPEWESSKTM